MSDPQDVKRIERLKRRLAKLSKAKDDEAKKYEEEIRELKADHAAFCQEHNLKFAKLKQENTLLKRDLGVDASLMHHFDLKSFSSMQDFIDTHEEKGIFLVPTETLEKIIPIGVIKMRDGEELLELEQEFDYLSKLEAWWRSDRELPLALHSRTKDCLLADLRDPNVAFQICLASQTIAEKIEFSVIRLLGIEIDALVILPKRKWLKWLSGLRCIYVDIKWAKHTLELSKVSMTQYWKDIKLICKKYGTFFLCAHAKILTDGYQAAKRGEEEDPMLPVYHEEGQPGAGLFHFLSTSIFDHAAQSLMESNLPQYTVNTSIAGFKEKDIPAFAEKFGKLNCFRRRGCAAHSNNVKFILSSNLFHKSTLQAHFDKHVEAFADPVTPPKRPVVSEQAVPEFSFIPNPVSHISEVACDVDNSFRPKKSTKTNANKHPSPYRKNTVFSPRQKNNSPNSSPTKRKVR